MNKNILLFTSGILVVIGILAFSPILGISDAVNTFVTLLAGVLFVLLHGSMTIGWKHILVFLLITVAVSFTLEAIGVATGLVFGPYYYTDNLGPKILGVPPMIQAGYTAMGYASLMTARVILNFRESPKNLGSIIAIALIGSFIMVAWDVAMDPYQSTLAGDWIWTTGGQYFGIGIHNFIGWFVTVFIFMFLYQLYASHYPEKIQKAVIKSRYLWSQPTLYYALVGLGMVVVPYVGGVSLPYASPQNYHGALIDLEYSIALIAFFVMGTPVAIALAKLFTSKETQAV